MADGLSQKDGPAKNAPVIRCAIYTRKSTEEGLDQDFNSLQAQREAAEAYIHSQKEVGWKLLPEHYNDGGFSGATLDRPALQRLLDEVDARRVDCIVVYKVDRLSRSLLDFARLIDRFDQHSVTFVSVTQQFNTTSSLGRLTLNILFSFAQFERELIGERTRDKMSAARRRARSLRPPSASACKRQATRRNRNFLFEDFDSWPNTSWYFFRNTITFELRNSSIAESTAGAMSGSFLWL